MKKVWQKVLCVMMVIAIVSTVSVAFVGCGNKPANTPGDNSGDGKGEGTPAVYYDNEADALVFSTLECDRVFNPFFSTSGTDSNVVGMTQIGMMGNNSAGEPVWGDDEAVIAKDVQIVTQGTENVDQTTTYYFVMKNNVKFSNGSPLTIKDVLFNYYVYLDPVYSGSSTIYSTDIVGLKEYRTQQSSETEQDNFNLQFQVAAQARMDALIQLAGDILDDNDNAVDLDEMRSELQTRSGAMGAGYANVVADFDKTVELFRQELNDDYSNSLNSYQDITFKDAEGNVYKNLLTTDVEAFLYNEGLIGWNKKDAELTSAFTTGNARVDSTVFDTIRSWSKEQAIEVVFDSKMPKDIAEVLTYWATSSALNEYLVNQAMESYFSDGSKRTYTNISGIKFANRSEAVVVNGTTYQVPQYNADGSPAAGSNEVLSITINGVDPKAIWNFSIGVAPMYYYSDAEHIAAANAADWYENDAFGVEYASQTFMNNVVKNSAKIGVPVGAGAYAASKSSGGLDNVQAGDFYSLGVIYFERNPYFASVSPTHQNAEIKKVRFKVVGSAHMLDSLYNSEVDFAEPNCKPETISQLNARKSQGIGNQSIRTAGYGYIGVNAGKVQALNVRRAIMYCINTQECVDYYKTSASAIYRSMSLSSWAYPKGAISYYPYIAGPIPAGDLQAMAAANKVDQAYADFVADTGKKAGQYFTAAEQESFITGLVENAGYRLNGNGTYQKGSDVLKYTFTIAGEETDHPAYNAMNHASELLNKWGFEINVTTDSNALKKLATGDLTVWAAAWGSTIDPDMYQVYHKDSKASSVLNWGYKQILQNVNGKYDVEMEILDRLSDLIDAGRRTNDQNRRANIYSQALDDVMELAVELPTYQRDDLFAYNAAKIDVNSFNKDVSPYTGLTSDIYSVSLIVER